MCTIFAPILAIKDVIGMKIKNAGIFTKPMLNGRFAFSKKPDVKKPIEPIDAIINPIAAELPIALLMGYPKYLKIGTIHHSSCNTHRCRYKARNETKRCSRQKLKLFIFF